MIGRTIGWGGQGDTGVVMDSFLRSNQGSGSSTYYLVKSVNGSIQTVSPLNVKYVKT
jgi:hypothetical protein